MISLIYDVTMNGKLRIDYSPSKSPTNEFIYGFRLYHSTEYTPQQVIQEIEEVIKNNKVFWITRVQDEWQFDFDKFKHIYPEYAHIEWLKDKVSVEPEIKTSFTVAGKPEYTVFRFTFNRESLKKSVPDSKLPIAIYESLKTFQRDFPESRKVALIMMFEDPKSSQDPRLEEIFVFVKNILEIHGIQGIRADDKFYHPDIFYNTLTYIYGCGFGIGIFNRIVNQELNPNVTFAVGYMMGLGKNVCLLKDSRMPTLPTDLVGKLGEPVDAQDLSGTIPPVLKKWLADKKLIQ